MSPGLRSTGHLSLMLQKLHVYKGGVYSLCVSFPGVLADARLLLPHRRHLQLLGADRDVLVALSCAWR